MAKGKGGLIVLGLSAVLATVGIYFGSKKQALERLDYSLSDFKIKLINGVFLVKLIFKIDNPSSQEFKFKSFEGSVYSDNQKLGDVSIPTPTIIKANQITPVELSTYIPANNVAQLVLDTLLTLKTPSKAIIKGSLDLGVIKIPVYNEIPLNAPTASKSA